MMESPEIINDNISLFSQDGSLAFGTDAYLLSAYMRKTSSASAELGCGNGVISLLAAARNKTGHITAFEIQPSLAEIAAKNVAYNRLSGKITVVCTDIKALGAEYNCRFHSVFANPPYLKTDSGKNSADISSAICRREFSGGISDFSRCASRLLCHGGLFTVVYRPDRCAELLCSLRAAGLEPKRMTLVYPTVSHTPCLVLCEAKKGAAEGMFLTRPLIIYPDAGNMTIGGYSDDMKYIYENGDFNGYYKKS